MEPFDALIHAHGGQVWRICRALAHPDDVDDAWQETFLAALRAYPTTDVKNPRAWLIGIAHRKCIDTHRRRRRDPLPVDVVEGNLPAHWDDVAGGEIWQAVAKLPDKQRRVIAYRYLGDLSYNDITRIVGGTPAAARRAAADGIANLRRNLKGES